jgi:ribosomal protein S18 acetylase RimI-like enzyme
LELGDCGQRSLIGGITLIFRSFELCDFDEVIALWKKAGLFLSQSDTLTGMEKKLARDPDLFFVAEEDSHIISVVMGSYDGRRGWINHLAVDPDYQGRKIGQKMIEELEKRFKHEGCDKVNLLIELSNGEVEHFYEKQGYQRDDLIFMEKWI